MRDAHTLHERLADHRDHFVEVRRHWAARSREVGRCVWRNQCRDRLTFWLESLLAGQLDEDLHEALQTCLRRLGRASVDSEVLVVAEDTSWAILTFLHYDQFREPMVMVWSRGLEEGTP